MYTVTDVRHSWPEPAGFCLYRPNGRPDYAFVHFRNEVDLILDEKQTTVPPHACILYAPYAPQHFISYQPLVHDWFHFVGEPFPCIPAGTILFPTHSDFIPELVNEIENEFFTQRPGRNELLHAKVTELLIRVSRELHPASERRHVYVDPAVRKKLSQLRQEVFHLLDQPWTVQQMADHIGLSPSRFHEIYRCVYDRSPIDDLIHARIDSAKHMLLFTSNSVSVIAEALGYLNETHFIRQFKQLTGDTPAHFRRLSSR